MRNARSSLVDISAMYDIAPTIKTTANSEKPLMAADTYRKYKDKFITSKTVRQWPFLSRLLLWQQVKQVFFYCLYLSTGPTGVPRKAKEWISGGCKPCKTRRQASVPEENAKQERNLKGTPNLSFLHKFRV